MMFCIIVERRGVTVVMHSPLIFFPLFPVIPFLPVAVEKLVSDFATIVSCPAIIVSNLAILNSRPAFNLSAIIAVLWRVA